jgi:hypothetical protein
MVDPLRVNQRDPALDEAIAQIPVVIRFFLHKWCPPRVNLNDVRIVTRNLNAVKINSKYIISRQSFGSFLGNMRRATKNAAGYGIFLRLYTIHWGRKKKRRSITASNLVD